MIKRRWGKIVALLPGSIGSAAFCFSVTSGALMTVHQSGGHGQHIQLATHLHLHLHPHCHWASKGFSVTSLTWLWDFEASLLLVFHFSKNVEDWWGCGLEACCHILNWACEKSLKMLEKNKTAVNTFVGLSNVAIASTLWSYTTLCCLDLTAFIHRVRKGTFLFLVASMLWNNQVLLILLLLFPKAFMKPLKSRKF